MQPARVIVVQMGDDQLGDVLGFDPQRLQRLAGIHQDRAVAEGGLRLVVAGVNEDDLSAPPQHPDEVIHRVGRVVVVVENEAVGARPRVAVGVFDGVDLPVCHLETVLKVRSSLSATSPETAGPVAL